MWLEVEEANEEVEVVRDMAPVTGPADEDDDGRGKAGRRGAGSPEKGTSTSKEG